MNTELFNSMKNDREKTLQDIKNMDTGLLFAELDDTIQFDILGIGNQEWTIDYLHKKMVYQAIVNELRTRAKNVT